MAVLGYLIAVGGSMGDMVAEQIAALKDEDWAIREDAATALGTLRDPRAVGPLVTLLRDSDRAVREAAIGALTALGEPAVTALGVCHRWLAQSCEGADGRL